MEDITVTHPGDSTAVIELHGEHDRVTSTDVAALLRSEVSSNDLVVVDVFEAVFIDSSVLHNLAHADRDAAERGSSFVLQMGTAPIVRTALKASGLLDQPGVAHTRDKALRQSVPNE